MPDQQTAGCVARRCANELSIHRYDAQTASGHTTPLDAAVALDAIDEIFVMLPVWENPPEASGRTLMLRATEGEQRSITLGPEGPRIDDQHGTPTSRSPPARRTSRSSSSNGRPSAPCNALATPPCWTAGTASSASTDATFGVHGKGQAEAKRMSARSTATTSAAPTW